MSNPSQPRLSKRRREQGAANDPTTEQVEQPKKRRMLEGARSSSNSSSDEAPTEPTPAKKAKKAKKPKKANLHAHNDDHDTARGLNLGIGRMDSQMLADYVAARTKRFEPDLSAVELEDRYVAARSIVDTAGWEGARDLDGLPRFLEALVDGQEDLKRVDKECGRPHTLVIAGAGLRAADVTRALRGFETKKGKVAKLFAKHIKIKEAVETCKTTRMNFGVGTPQRVMDLLEDGALSTKSLKRIVIDASHMDLKKRGILEMKDTQVPLVKLLNLPLLKERYNAEDRIALVFY